MITMEVGGLTVNADLEVLQRAVRIQVTPAQHAFSALFDTKAFAADVASRPEAKGWQGLTYSRFGDEFGATVAAKGAKLPRLGDRLEFIVPHCDPTVNLYDRVYAIRGEQVEAIWPVLARREVVQGKK